ncbi:MAG TPA: PilN domain-containing protein [Gammaproteobacteria bacterium]|jgi:type IV pilus assembly protein PilN|nr:PilN domain-containing protein [Gammaproteobacteria bacterium]
MARINLLPWREERRKLRQRQFNVVMIVVGVASAFTVFLLWGAMDTAINNQNARNAYLTDQIKLMDDKIAQIKDLQDTKQRLLARMQIIQQLQESRPIEVHLFDQLVKTLPPGIYLTSISQNGASLTLQGVAESSARVSTYLRNIDASPWLGEPNLQVVQKDNAKSGAQTFSITAKVEDKNAQQQKDKDAAGGAP